MIFCGDTNTVVEVQVTIFGVKVLCGWFYPEDGVVST
jgi:hypothetical protein